MCGFVACIGPRSKLPDASTLGSAVALQQHRGPDSQSLAYVGNLVLGFRRLAILDLNERSDQPFSYGPVTLVYNGEIYNYRELRSALEQEGATFRCTGDTEVVAAAVCHWGVPEAARRFRGMWSAVVHDERTGITQVTRDRFGIKPLFFSDIDGLTVFSTEIKSIMALMPHRPVINEAVLRAFVREGEMDETDATFFADIHRFPSASIMEIAPDGRRQPPFAYWQPTESAEQAYDPGRLNGILREALSQHLRSDAPIGVALSGGVDSSIIAGFAKDAPNVRFFSLRHPIAANENPLVKETCQSLGLDHAFVEVEDVETVGTIDALLKTLDQPFKSTNTLYQFSIRKAAVDRGCKVLLTGDGADEVFGGYTKCVPFYFRDLIRQGNIVTLGQSIFDLAPFLGMSPVKVSKMVARQVLASAGQGKSRSGSKGALKSYLHERLFRSPLPYWLRVEDGISMALSLETRVPFLDHEIFDYVNNLPTSRFFADGFNKYYLRAACRDIMPLHIQRERTKYQRPTSDGRLIFDKLLPEVAEVIASDAPVNNVLSDGITIDQFLIDAEARQNERFWLRSFLALRWLEQLRIQPESA